MLTQTRNPNLQKTGVLTLKYRDFWGHIATLQLRPAGTDWVVVGAWTELFGPCQHNEHKAPAYD